jgi:hypothetical protein
MWSSPVRLPNQHFLCNSYLARANQLLFSKKLVGGGAETKTEGSHFVLQTRSYGKNIWRPCFFICFLLYGEASKNCKLLNNNNNNNNVSKIPLGT